MRKEHFLAHGADYSLLLGGGEAVLGLARKSPPNVLHELARARKTSQISGEDEQTATSNYFIGSDPAKWRTGVVHYGKVRYREAYPGIDQVYYGNQGKLEYDLIVAPGANYEQIGLRFAGLKRVRIDGKTGELVLKFGDGSEVRQQKPNVYQDVDGAKREIAGNYLLKGQPRSGLSDSWIRQTLSAGDRSHDRILHGSRWQRRRPRQGCRHRLGR